MEYNTNRGNMAYREYGRTIGKMIEKVCRMEEGETRRTAAKAIVTAMGTVSGVSLKDDVAYHKLWDHLMRMSDFRLEDAWPFDKGELEQMKADNGVWNEGGGKKRLPYSDGKISNRQYGQLLEKMVKKIKTLPDGEELNELVMQAAQQTKRDYLTWNGELGDDSIIVDWMVETSGDERIRKILNGKAIIVPVNTMPKDVIHQKKKKKKK